MDQQANLTQPEHLSYNPNHHIKVYVLIALVVATVLVAINGYLYFLRLSYLQQGLVAHQEGERKVQELQSQRQLEVPSDWKIYTNQDYNFQFTLNDNWSGYKATRWDCYLVIGLNDNTDEKIPYWTFEIPTSDYEWNTAIRPSREGYMEVMHLRLYTLSQWARALKQKPEIVIQQNENYVITYTESIDYPRSFDLKTLKIPEVISTFKFIDSIDTSTWKTYRNEEYGFEFKYPGGWEVTKGMGLEVFIRKENSDGFPEITIWIYAVLDINIDQLTDSYKLNNSQKTNIVLSGVLGKKMSGLSTTKLSNGSDWHIDLIVLSKEPDYYYMIQADNFDEVLLNQILSTFKF